jgi:DNA repair photolyase
MMSQTELLQAPTARGLTVLDTRLRGATFVEHSVKSIVNPPESTGMGFWSINPYVGCELGCTYCYARYAHRYVIQRAHEAGRITADELAQFEKSERWESFERQIFVKRKKTVLAALEHDLEKMRRRNRAGDVYPVVIGTATDPYQPAERQFGITRAILKRLQREWGLGIGLITKSPLVCRDIELLVELQRRNRLSVYISLITTDVRLIKLFEARTPMPHARLKALRQLASAGINAGLIVAPILPGITDTVPQIRELARAVRDAGGRFAHPSPLRLYPALHRGFLPIVEEHFPELVVKYRRAYRGTGTAPKSYTDAVVKRFRRVASRYGVPVSDPTLDRSPQHGSAPAVDINQLELWG